MYHQKATKQTVEKQFEKPIFAVRGLRFQQINGKKVPEQEKSLFILLDGQKGEKFS